MKQFCERGECERRDLLKRVSDLEEALDGLIDGVTSEVNEKGGGGYVLARLTDAKNIRARR